MSDQSDARGIAWEWTSESSSGALSPHGITGLLIVTLVCWTAFVVVRVAAGAHGAALDLGLFLVSVVGVLVLQILHSLPQAQTWPCHRRAASLAGQASLTYVALAAPGVDWASTAGFLAASFALLLPSRVAWAVSAAVPVSLLALPLLFGHPWVATVCLVTSTVVSGVVVVGLVAVRELVRGAHSAGQAMARAAVAQERLRFARDLHDHLGNTLSAIALRSEIAHRIAPESSLTRREVGEVADLARRALAEARSLAPGEGRLSTSTEARSAVALLRAAGVDVEVTMRFGLLPADVEAVLATVLREGAANVIRHSAARRCHIVGEVVGGHAVVELVNDGVDVASRVRAMSGGAGLRNLMERTAELGGTVTAGPTAVGSFRIVASVPLPSTCRMWTMPGTVSAVSG